MSVQIGQANDCGTHYGNHASAMRTGHLHLLGIIKVDLPAHTSAATALQLYDAEWRRHMALMRRAVADMEADNGKAVQPSRAVVKQSLTTAVAGKAVQPSAGQRAPTGGPP
jgi:hypothetical protein